jgi:hypothetical protein
MEYVCFCNPQTAIFDRNLNNKKRNIILCGNFNEHKIVYNCYTDWRRARTFLNNSPQDSADRVTG